MDCPVTDIGKGYDVKNSSSWKYLLWASKQRFPHLGMANVAHAVPPHCLFDRCEVVKIYIFIFTLS